MHDRHDNPCKYAKYSSHIKIIEIQSSQKFIDRNILAMFLYFFFTTYQIHSSHKFVQSKTRQLHVMQLQNGPEIES